MGAYLNPGGERFAEALRSQIYVDKTEAVLYLNSVVRTKQKYVSVSRPRRFGKTMAADLLCAYFGRGADSHALFEGTKLAGHDDWDAFLGVFDVVRITVTDFIKEGKTVEEGLARMQVLVVRDLVRQNPDVDFFDPSDLALSMQDLYDQTGVPFVVVIDEWDAPIRERRSDARGQKVYLDFLRDWLKDKDYVALAYMTGILPIKKYGGHSALNMFDEYSMVAPMQLAEFTGFTDDEVNALCDTYHMDYGDVSDWYDGYTVSNWIPVSERESFREGLYQANRYSLYSPLSVVRAVSTGFIRNYWNDTETFEALASYIRMDFDGLKDTVALLMDGGRAKVDLAGYQNDMTTFHSREDVLALLIHLGYLGYDDRTGEVFIPNRELLDVFRVSTRSEEFGRIEPLA